MISSGNLPSNLQIMLEIFWKRVDRASIDWNDFSTNVQTVEAAIDMLDVYERGCTSILSIHKTVYAINYKLGHRRSSFAAHNVEHNNFSEYLVFDKSIEFRNQWRLFMLIFSRVRAIVSKNNSISLEASVGGKFS